MKQEQLIAAVAELGAPYRFERSFRLSSKGLFSNRCLLSVTKDAISQSPNKSIVSLCQELQMPDDVLTEVQRELEAVSFVHWGWEKHAEQLLYKFYLEHPIVDIAAEQPNGTQLLHRAFKWNPLFPEHTVRTEYRLHPDLVLGEIKHQLASFYQNGTSTQTQWIANSILEKTAEKIRAQDIQFLEVAEDGNQRNSFDLNLYDANLAIGDLRSEILAMANAFQLSEIKTNAFLDQINHHAAGHLAGGTHRNGSEFFNVYYGAEQWSETQLPAKSDPPNVAVGEDSQSAPSWQQFTRAGDRYFNYCWWPYTPVAAVEHKMRPVSLLYQSFDLAGISQGAFDLVEAIQAEIGLFRTVWGIKYIDGRLAWEFYIYDYQRRARDVSIARVLKSIAHIAPCKFSVNEALPYFMFSIDLDEALVSGKRDLDVVHMYVGNPGSTVSSGIAYALTANSKTLENFYFFFDAKNQLNEAADKITSSVHLDDTVLDVNNILRPELRDCHTICVANKQTHDTAYFSGVNVDQLIFFLAWLKYPQPIREYVETHRGKLDHLLYDVGFDYTTSGSDIRILKSGYYGVF